MGNHLYKVTIELKCCNQLVKFSVIFPENVSGFGISLDGLVSPSVVSLWLSRMALVSCVIWVSKCYLLSF